MFCPKCGVEGHEGDAYCQSCGTALPQGDSVRRESSGGAGGSDPSALRMRTAASAAAKTPDASRVRLMIVADAVLILLMFSPWVEIGAYGWSVEYTIPGLLGAVMDLESSLSSFVSSADVSTFSSVAIFIAVLWLIVLVWLVVDVVRRAKSGTGTSAGFIEAGIVGLFVIILLAGVSSSISSGMTSSFGSSLGLSSVVKPTLALWAYTIGGFACVALHAAVSRQAKLG